MKELTRSRARRKLEMYGAMAMAQAVDAGDRREWVALQETIAR